MWANSEANGVVSITLSLRIITMPFISRFFAIILVSMFLLSNIHAITLPPTKPTSSNHQPAQAQCAIYLAPSTLADGIGRGVFAGKNFTKEEKINTMISVTIPYDILWEGDWSLRNYVFAHDEEDICLSVFGVAMLFNHRGAEKVHHYWDDYDVALSKDSTYTPSSVMTHVVFETTTDVKLGEELYVDYGGNGWFRSRGLDVVDGTSRPDVEETVPQAYLHEYGFCYDDVEFKASAKPLAGIGLFAKRDFKKGEIVTISPILPLPAPEIELITVESVLQNYCISAPGSQVALLPIGYAGGINHEANPNVVMDWYDGWKSPDVNKSRNMGAEFLRKSLEKNTESILSIDYSPFDLKYTATRDILKGEEITIDYGNAWVEEWAKYLAETLDYNSKRNFNPFDKIPGISKRKDIGDPPLFRQFIMAPPGLLPVQWDIPDPRRPLLHIEESEEDTELPEYSQKQESSILDDNTESRRVKLEPLSTLADIEIASNEL